MIYVIISLLITSLGIFFGANSNHPGTKDLIHQINPLTLVFQRTLGCTHRLCTWLTIIPVYGTGYSFLFAVSRKLQSMAMSGMVIPLFKKKIDSTGAPIVPLLFASVVCLCIIIPVRLIFSSFEEDVFHWCIIGSFFTYVCAFVSFIELRRKYGVLDRSFVSPWGIPGAIIGLCVFAITFISTVAFQDMRKPFQHRLHPLAGFIGFTVIGIVWYFIYAQKYQCFSSDEQKIMFSAYVIKCKLSALCSNLY